MQAAFYGRQGPAQEVFQFGELPTPTPGHGEVRVRLHASGVNPSDWKLRKGGYNRALIAPVIVPHSDGAGVIDAVGEGVPASRIGERVWVWNGHWKRALGTAAQFIALPSAQAVALPASTSFDEGACLGIPALTAAAGVRLVAAAPGMHVLVAAGAGSVGHYAIQLAKARGATVITTVSSQAKADHARAAGADHVVNYKQPDAGAQIMAATGGRGVDAVIEMDLTTNAALYPSILKPRAEVAVYGMLRNDATLPSLWLMQNSVALRFFFVYELGDEQRRGALQELGSLLAEGKLKHTIGLRLPLQEAARAHELIEQGQVMGNVVLEIAH